MSVPESELDPEAAQVAFDQALSALDWARAEEGAGSKEARAAYGRMQRAGRDLAAALGDEWAEVFDFGPRWSAGAPLPQVVANESGGFLVYLMEESDPGWDGRTTRSVDPGRGEEWPLAIVSFQGHVRFGGPNDEVLSGHPLYGRGLEFYAAHRIHNSRWIAEDRAINSVHPRHRPEAWDDTEHLLLAFHDSIVELMTDRYEVSTVCSTFRAVLHDLVDRLR